ncbi:MAG: 1-acyl-sn-glycerol-3-phosphate acyltransferase [Myxococcaceae bacterium]|nr:1-acyl-sn-glycerol-3-phosphate acyltransferase [Myxococcaceae bacterium]
MPHPAAPSLAAEPLPHAHAPDARALGAGPVPHPAAPSLATEPLPHAHTPVARALGAGPVTHPGAPSLATVDDPGPAPTPRPQRRQPLARPSTPPRPTLEIEAAAAQASSLQEAPATGAPRPSQPPPDAEPRAPTAIESTPAAAGVSLLSAEGALTSLQGIAAALRTLAGRSTAQSRVDAFGRDEALVGQLQPLADALYERWFRVTVEGAEHVPAGPCLLVANHAGALPIDGPVLHHALKRSRADLPHARWLLEDQVFFAPGLGVLWNRLGAVRASPDNAHALLEQGLPVIVFPEGFQALSRPFKERYRVQRFGRGGYVKIAARAGVPVVPVAVVGADESVPLLGKLPGGLLGLPFLPVTLPPLPARWFIRFGEPMPLHEAGAAAADDLAWVQRTNDAVRDTIDRMLKALLDRRGGVF